MRPSICIQMGRRNKLATESMSRKRKRVIFNHSVEAAQCQDSVGKRVE